MRRLAVLAIIVMVAGCSGSSSGGGLPDPVPAESVQNAATVAPHANCIERAEVAPLSKAIASDFAKVATAMSDGDFDGALAAQRAAAAKVRQLADLVSVVESEAARGLYRTADALDNATSALAEFDIDNANSYAIQGLEELKPAMEAVAALYC